MARTNREIKVNDKGNSKNAKLSKLSKKQRKNKISANDMFEYNEQTGFIFEM